jgi:hypothetical protein
VLPSTNKSSSSSSNNNNKQSTSTQQQQQQHQQQDHQTKYYSQYTQDVHRCNSALCLECRADLSAVHRSGTTAVNSGRRNIGNNNNNNNKVRFIPVRMSSFSSLDQKQQQHQQQQEDLYSWYDGSDVDFSSSMHSAAAVDPTTPRSSYATPDTVHL